MHYAHYVEYLQGEETKRVDGKLVFDENLTHVDYSDVTLNLGNYWKDAGTGSRMRNESHSDEETDISISLE